MKLISSLAPCMAAAAVRAGELVIPLTLDPAASELTTTLCIQGECSSDTHPLAGELLVVLAGNAAERQAALLDLRLAATTNHHADLDYGFGGRVTAVLSNLVIRHAAPAAPPTWQPVTEEAVTFRTIPNILAGDLAYSATGLACALVGSAGLPCVAVRDLAQRDPNTIDTLGSELVITAGRARLTGAFGFSERIVPDQPALGEVRGAVVLTAVGELRPVLAIRPVEGGFELRWSGLAEGFVAEKSSDLGTAWQPLGITPELTADDWTVAVPGGAEAAYYRLRAP